jgi:hypothetical protein
MISWRTKIIKFLTDLKICSITKDLSINLNIKTLFAKEKNMLRNKHRMLLFVAVTCILLIFFQGICLSTSDGEIVIEKPIWTEGDYWNYVAYLGDTPESGLTGSLQIKVEEKESIVVNNESYQCRKVIVSVQMPHGFENTTCYYLENSTQLVTYLTETLTGTFDITYDPIIDIPPSVPLRILMSPDNLKYYPSACYIEYPLTHNKTWKKNTMVTVSSYFGDDYVQKSVNITSSCQSRVTTEIVKSFGELSGVMVLQKMKIEGRITPETVSSAYFFAEEIGSLPVKFNINAEGVSFTVELFEYGNEFLQTDSTDVTMLIAVVFVILIGAAVVFVFWQGKKYGKD